MGLFSTIFGIGKKLAMPLMNLGKRAYGALGSIGRKIGSFFGRTPKPAQPQGALFRGASKSSGKSFGEATAQVGKEVKRFPKSETMTFNPRGNQFSRGGGLFPPPSGNTPF